MSTSVWKNTAGERQIQQELSENIHAEVCIIGGGITGLTLALELTKAGKDVVVLEAYACGDGTTGASSNHLTTHIDYSYHNLQKHHGDEIAQIVALSRSEALDYIENISLENNVDCNFKWVPGYYYAEYEEHVKPLEKEYKAAKKAGLPVSQAQDLSLPFVIKKAIKFERQAVFHSQKYINGLAQLLASAACRIYENSRVHHYDKNTSTVKTPKGSVISNHIVMATHLPLFINLHQTTSAPYRSYMMAVKTEKYPPEGLYWDLQNPYHYIRIYEHKDEKWLIVGGADHKTGEDDPTVNYYHELEHYIDARFGIKKIDYRWSSQYYEPADGLPYIGKSPFGDTWMATGYSGDGLVYGTVAGLLLKDMILEKENNWVDAYDARRIKPLAAAKNFVQENLNVGKHFIADRLGNKKGETLAADSGTIVNEDGKHYAIYKDASHQVHVSSAVCPHLGCVVQWNHMEKTWDCPCHGSRFAPDGSLIIGPATDDLEKAEIKKEA